MLLPVPVLETYGISHQFGFLPPEQTLDRLPDPYYNKWENTVANLQGLILSNRLRGVIDRLPVLSTSGLVHDSEWRRAYSILCFMAHSYIWGHNTPSERLPPPISVPLLHVSAYLELPPVATYAALCLWNYRGLFTDEKIDNLDNLATHITFTGSTDESWFYLVSVAIEARGAPTLPLMLQAIEAARVNDNETVINCLQDFAEILNELGSLLERIHERCDPHIFYHRIRPFLAGSENMKDAGLANGVIYEDGTGSDEFRQFAGGSNAQSSLIQFFDIILGIEHYPTGELKKDAIASSAQCLVPPSKQNFLLEMRKYMPGPHRRFLEDVTKVANIRNYVHTNHENSELTIAYDACLKMLSDFRSLHIRIVSRYIILKSRESKSSSLLNNSETQRQKVDISTSSTKTSDQSFNRKPLKGTGGTNLIPFLKQARDETGKSASNVWAKRIMNRIALQEKNEITLESKNEKCRPVDIEIGNLSGIWTLGEDFGGLCHY